MRHTHQPVIALAEERSQLQAFLHFLGPALIYSIRHLTIGTWIRLRRSYLRRRREIWWIQ